MTLSSKLAGRTLPRITVPIQLSDPGDDLRQRHAEAIRGAELAAALVEQGAAGALGAEGTAIAERLTAEASRLTAEISEFYADVTLQAIPGPQWEAIVSAHSQESDDDGTWDLAASALPFMLAACVVAEPGDDDIRDPQWWAEQLSVWPEGDRHRLRAAVLTVNAPDGYQRLRVLGKG